MVDYLDQIKEIEDEIKKTQYNKATQHHIGLLKAKIAKLKEKQVARSSSKGKSDGFTVRKSGDSTVILIGFPSVGKSTLLNRLTNAESKTGHYAFTTLTCIPGLMEYNHAKIQILDVPGIVKGAAAGTGRGKEVLSVIRNADMVLIVIDIFDLEQFEALQKEIIDSNIRLNQKKPDVTIKKADRGGIQVATTKKLTKITEATIKAILHEFRINNATVLIRDDIDADQLIDIIEDNKKYVPSLMAINKIDLANKKQIAEAKNKFPDAIFISAGEKVNIEKLKKNIFKTLNLMRIYLKEQGKKADMEEPLIMKSDSSVEDLCRKLHKDFVEKFKHAKVTGPSSKYPNQRFKIKHVLKDQDVVQIFVS